MSEYEADAEVVYEIPPKIEDLNLDQYTTTQKFATLVERRQERKKAIEALKKEVEELDVQIGRVLDMAAASKVLMGDVVVIRRAEGAPARRLTIERLLKVGVTPEQLSNAFEEGKPRRSGITIRAYKPWQVIDEDPSGDY